MSLNKKNSRPIRVNGAEFRWTISPAMHQITFVAESSGVKGRKIEVLIDSDINSFWVEFPNVEDLNLKIITPKDAENIIAQALKSGWIVSEKGPPMRFEFKNETLEIMSKH
ncbi:MAG: hypothetical protein V4538_12640 [Bacteroidota bacterium]